MIYNDLALFNSVATHLSFSKAAGTLGIPLSRVSRRVAVLEEHLGLRLFERSTRKVRLTAEGKQLLDRCQQPIEALQGLAGISDTTRSQTIHVTAPPLAVRTTVGPKLLSFAEQNPEISINLTSTIRNLDFVSDNIDLAFRLGPMRDSSLIARKIWTVPYSFCATGTFLERHRTGPVLSLDRLLSLPAIMSRQPWLLKDQRSVEPGQIVHMFDDLDLVRDAASRHMGVAMLPRDLIEEPLLSLEVQGADLLSRDMQAVYSSKRLLPARVRELIDFMADGPA